VPAGWNQHGGLDEILKKAERIKYQNYIIVILLKQELKLFVNKGQINLIFVDGIQGNNE
jgi:hypothetical protein